LPVCGHSPVFSGKVNEINRRIFDLRISLRVSQMLRQATLEFCVGRGSGRVRTQIVSKQKRVALIGSPWHSHVSMSTTLTKRREEEHLFPV